MQKQQIFNTPNYRDRIENQKQKESELFWTDMRPIHISNKQTNTNKQTITSSIKTITRQNTIQCDIPRVHTMNETSVSAHLLWRHGHSHGGEVVDDNELDEAAALARPPIAHAKSHLLLHNMKHHHSKENKHIRNENQNKKEEQEQCNKNNICCSLPFVIVYV
jgi:hypothetical protein